MLTKPDLDLIKSKGISPDLISSHIQNFKTGFPFAYLQSAASVGHGIVRFNEDEIKELTDYFESKSKEKDILKFVPASGAASRMFKHLFEFRDQLIKKQGTYEFKNHDFNSVAYFFEHLKDFAFFQDLKDIMKFNGRDIEECIKNKDYLSIINFLLDSEGLDYASLPKGLLKFHNYSTGARLAIEEHLIEGAIYAKSKQSLVKIHFTVSPEHLEKFQAFINMLQEHYEKQFNIKYEVTFSIQKPSTDMVAVDLKNQPLRNEKGELIFRPGGHGALIENLNDIDTDIIFIKNIDNIVPDRLREPTYQYKKLIAAHLMRLQERCFRYLKKLLEAQISEESINEIEKYAREKLWIDLSDQKLNESRSEYLYRKLNRPIRICGMVKNEGEPGGGPFWVLNKEGTKSLQIVESSQIDLNDPQQKEIMNKSTHFNPVDLVCGIRDFEGNKFDLRKFVDPKTGFISIKSQNGKELKAQELPGLWNGAMANWITVFVECPIITFNPVKTINDLLRDQHR